jgi:O-antigen/teichoic acid export membrane protein
MNDSPSRPPDSVEFIAAEATTIIADESPAPLPPQNAGTPVIGSAVWTITGFGVMQVLRFGCNLVLTRLVEKYVFGVMTTVNLCIQGLHMFSDLGVRQCVVNSRRGDEDRFLNTAWSVQVVRGLTLFLVALIIAWPLGWFYGQAAMYWLIPFLGLTAVCDGFMSTAALTMSRTLRLGPLVIREIGSYVIGMSLTVACLLLLRWQGYGGENAGDYQMIAFAAGIVTVFFVEMAFSHTLIRGVRNSFAWDPSAGKELMHFGGWIFVSTVFTFFANNLDRLYVGKISQEGLADYNIAAQVARAPTLLIARLGQQFLFPLYGRLSRSDIPLIDSFPQLHSAMTGFAAFLIAVAVAAGPTFVWLMFPAEYHYAGDYVRWLSIAAWFTILQSSSEAALLAQGRTRQLAVGQAAKLALLLPLLVLGHHYFGVIGINAGYTAAEAERLAMIGIIAGYTLSEAARYVVLSAALAKQGLPVLRLDLVLTILIALSAMVAMLLGPYLEWTGGRFARFGVRCVGEAAIIGAFWTAVLVVWWPRHGRQTLAMVQGNG